MNFVQKAINAFKSNDTSILDKTLVRHKEACEKLKSKTKELKEAAKAARECGQTEEESAIMQQTIKQGQGRRPTTQIKLKPIEGSV
jgi:hypothetical protein